MKVNAEREPDKIVSQAQIKEAPLDMVTECGPNVIHR